MPKLHLCYWDASVYAFPLVPFQVRLAIIIISTSSDILLITRLLTPQNATSFSKKQLIFILQMLEEAIDLYFTDAWLSVYPVLFYSQILVVWSKLHIRRNQKKTINLHPEIWLKPRLENLYDALSNSRCLYLTLDALVFMKCYNFKIKPSNLHCISQRDISCFKHIYKTFYSDILWHISHVFSKFME